MSAEYIFNTQQNRGTLRGKLSRIEAVDSGDENIENLIGKILSLYTGTDSDDADGDGDHSSPAGAVSVDNGAYAADDTQMPSVDALSSAE